MRRQVVEPPLELKRGEILRPFRALQFRSSRFLRARRLFHGHVEKADGAECSQDEQIRRRSSHVEARHQE